jgi:hypothetical protein
VRGERIPCRGSEPSAIICHGGRPVTRVAPWDHPGDRGNLPATITPNSIRGQVEQHDECQRDPRPEVRIGNCVFPVSWPAIHQIRWRELRAAQSPSGDGAAEFGAVVRGVVEPPTLGFAVTEQTAKSSGNTTVSASAGANAGAVETKICSPDADWQAIIDAWPSLPDALRAGILAMAEAAR